MTQHHIAGSEAHRPSAHFIVRVGRRRRTLHPAVTVLGTAAAIGLIASLIDAAIGQPVCLTLCALGFLCLWLVPGGQ